jgi:hypothetical protein
MQSFKATHVFQIPIWPQGIGRERWDKRPVETEDKGLVEIKGYYSPSPDCRKVKL